MPIIYINTYFFSTKGESAWCSGVLHGSIFCPSHISSPFGLFPDSREHSRNTLVITVLFRLSSE